MKAFVLVLSSLISSFTVGGSSTIDAGAAVDELECAACRSLGFAPKLPCSTCDRIKDVVADEALTNECTRCCTETKRSAKTYISAKLVYDPRLLAADVQLRGFIENRAADHPALTLQPTMYAKTALLMSEEREGTSEVDTVSIRRWKEDAIADYLREHLS